MGAVAKVLPVVAGVALIATGVGAPAGAGLLGTIGAGAEIAGGALTLYGAATGNTNLEKIGGLIGVGGLAMGMMAPAGAATVPAAGADTGGMQMATEMGGGTTPAAAAGSETISAAGAASAAPTAATDVNQAILAGQQQMMKYSLVSGGISGAAQAYEQRKTADIAAQTAANNLALQRELANRANTSGGGVGMDLSRIAPSQGSSLLTSGGVPVPPPISVPNVVMQPPPGLTPPTILTTPPVKLA